MKSNIAGPYQKYSSETVIQIESRWCMNDQIMNLYKICDFGANPKSKLAATAYFKVGLYGKFIETSFSQSAIQIESS